MHVPSGTAPVTDKSEGMAAAFTCYNTKPQPGRRHFPLSDATAGPHPTPSECAGQRWEPRCIGRDNFRQRPIPKTVNAFLGSHAALSRQPGKILAVCQQFPLATVRWREQPFTTRAIGLWRQTIVSDIRKRPFVAANGGFFRAT